MRFGAALPSTGSHVTSQPPGRGPRLPGIFTAEGRGDPRESAGIRGLEGEGWSGLRPLVLIKVRRCKSTKTLASDRTPFSVVPVPFSIPMSLVLPVPFLEIIVVPVFAVK